MKKLKRNYINTDNKLRAMMSNTELTETQKIKQIKILIPKWTKLQSALISLGVKINTINYNI